MKRYTEKKALLACNRVLADASKCKATRGDLASGWIDGSGRALVMDGYRAFRLNVTPAGLDICDNVRAYVAKARAGLERELDSIDTTTLVEMPAPDEAAIKACMHGGKIFDLGPDFPAINARYLRDVIDVFPNCKWYCSNGPRRMSSPIYAISPDGIAFILPVRINQKANWKSK